LETGAEREPRGEKKWSGRSIKKRKKKTEHVTETKNFPWDREEKGSKPQTQTRSIKNHKSKPPTTLDKNVIPKSIKRKAPQLAWGGGWILQGEKAATIVSEGDTYYMGTTFGSKKITQKNNHTLPFQGGIGLGRGRSEGQIDK